VVPEHLCVSMPYLILSMGIEEYGAIDQQAAERFGKKVVQKYGVKPCEAARRLEETNLSKGSKESYKPQVREIVKELDDLMPEPEDVVNYVSNVEKQSSTKDMMVMAMKKYYETYDEYKMGKKVMRLARESTDKELAYTGGMEVNEWLTVEEVNHIFDYILPVDGNVTRFITTADQQFVLTLEHKALFSTLYYTALRVGEATMLKVEDFYPERNEVEVYRLKKRGPDIPRDMIAVPEVYMDTIQHYIEEYEISNGEVFDYTPRTARNRIEEINDAYKYVIGDFDHTEKLTPHKLRHARVTAIANHSGIEEAGDFVNHSSVDITDAYRHIATEEQREFLPEESDDIGEVKPEVQQLMDELDISSKDQLIEQLKIIKDMET